MTDAPAERHPATEALWAWLEDMEGQARPKAQREHIEGVLSELDSYLFELDAADTSAASDSDRVGPIEVAEHLGIAVSRVFVFCGEGLPHERTGRELRFDLAAVDEWIEQHGGDA